MKPDVRLRSAVRGFYAWIGSMIVLGVAPLVALRLAESSSMAARLGAVILGVGGTLPWMWVVYSIIRRGDEFVRRMHLVAFGFAFAGSILMLIALDWMARAGFIGPPDLIAVVGGAMILWVVALFGAKFYFERDR